MLKHLVEIGFPTRNRWGVVRTTLERLADFGLGDVRIVILDDGSDQACPFDAQAICPGAEIVRHEESRGMIVRRNQIASLMRAKYYLGIDDDSYPVAGSIEAALAFAESRSDLLSLSFPIYMPRRRMHQVRSLDTEPYPVRGFIGCGHMLHRETFLALGGFQESFRFFLEEPEVSMRGYLAGHHCYHFPGLSFHHVETSTARNWARMDFWGSRNAVLFNDWYLPRGRLTYAKQAAHLLVRLWLAVSTRRIGHLKGYFAGMGSIKGAKNRRAPMTNAQYRRWRALPAT
jgi:GT2 family glycosyltransferase